MLEKKDITKSLEIEFEMLCSKKGYDESALTSRYILRENKQDFDKYKAIYISANKTLQTNLYSKYLHLFEDLQSMSNLLKQLNLIANPEHHMI